MSEAPVEVDPDIRSVAGQPAHALAVYGVLLGPIANDEPLLCPYISLAAKGLLAIYDHLTHEGHDVTDFDLTVASGESTAAVRHGLDELARAGLMLIGKPAEAARPQRAELESSMLDEKFRHVPPDRPGEIVYYVRRQDSLIKIGYSSNLQSRLTNLRKKHGKLETLATEPGGWHKEHERHGQFEVSRVHPNGEWFRPDPDLLRHIELLRTEEPGPR